MKCSPHLVHVAQPQACDLFDTFVTSIQSGNSLMAFASAFFGCRPLVTTAQIISKLLLRGNGLGGVSSSASQFSPSRVTTAVYSLPVVLGGTLELHA